MFESTAGDEGFDRASRGSTTDAGLWETNDAGTEPLPTTWLDELEAPELGPVSWLGELAPSGRLLTELERLPEDLVEDDYEAIEVTALWHRLEAYCAGRKRRAAADVARRRTMAAGLAGWDGSLGRVAVDGNVAADELSLRLGVSRMAAKRLVASGRALGGVGIPVADALAAGEIDAAKADLIVEAVSELPADAALEVQDRVLTRAGHLPSGSVRRELSAACAGVDPENFEQRCHEERKTRRVCRPRTLPHGMASLYAVMPAVEATGLYRAVDAAARSAKSVGDSRTMDQLRADALALMGTVAVQTGWIGTPPRIDRSPAVAPDAERVLDAGRAPGPDCASEPERSPRPDHAPRPARAPQPGHAPDDHATGGDRAVDVAVDVAVEAPLSVRPGSEAVAPPPPPPCPGSDQSHERAASDAPTPHPPHTGADQSGEQTASLTPSPHPPRTDADQPHEQPDDPPDRPPDNRMRVGVIGGRSAHVRVVVPLTALMGGSGDHAGGPDAPDAPAHLDGYGPIPASVARALAAGSTWSRLVQDPVDGRVREVSAPTYRPPTSMAELVRAEQPQCARPGCTVPADLSDLDHVIPWPVGATDVDNLRPLCRRDHLLVTHGGWASSDVVGDPSGAAADAVAADSAAAICAKPTDRDESDAAVDPPPGVLTPSNPTTSDLLQSSVTGARPLLSRTWTTASGHVYTERADGTIEQQARTMPDDHVPPPY